MGRRGAANQPRIEGGLGRLLGTVKVEGKGGKKEEEREKSVQTEERTQTTATLTKQTTAAQHHQGDFSISKKLGSTPGVGGDIKPAPPRGSL